MDQQHPVVEVRWTVKDQEAAIGLILELDHVAARHVSELVSVLVTVDGEVVRRSTE